VFFEFCRDQEVTTTTGLALPLCYPVHSIVTIVSGNEICTEVLTNMMPPADMVIDVTATTSVSVPFMPPVEVIPGSCGPFEYNISPNPELFMIVNGQIQVLPGFDPTIFNGLMTFTLTAGYLNFPQN